MLCVFKNLQQNIAKLTFPNTLLNLVLHKKTDLIVKIVKRVI